MEQVIPCNGKWFAVFLGASLGSEKVFLQIKQVCAWKYIQDEDDQYTLVEPIVWKGKRAESCQNDPGFRGCVPEGGAQELAQAVSDPDIGEIPLFTETCVQLGIDPTQAGHAVRVAKAEREKAEASV